MHTTMARKRFREELFPVSGQIKKQRTENEPITVEQRFFLTKKRPREEFFPASGYVKKQRKENDISRYQDGLSSIEEQSLLSIFQTYTGKLKEFHSTTNRSSDFAHSCITEILATCEDAFNLEASFSKIVSNIASLEDTINNVPVNTYEDVKEIKYIRKILILAERVLSMRAHNDQLALNETKTQFHLFIYN